MPSLPSKAESIFFTQTSHIHEIYHSKVRIYWGIQISDGLENMTSGRFSLRKLLVSPNQIFNTTLMWIYES
jgi:hypothetical protein